MRKFFGFILSPIFYLTFFLFLCIFHPIQWLCFRFFGYRAHKISVDVLNFLLHNNQMLLFNKVSFENKQNLPLNKPIVFLANHQSMYDIPGMIWRLRKYHPKFISKIELAKGIPSVSYNLRVGGGANIDRKNNKQAIMEIARLGKRMEENNWSAVIFPEGTRPKDGRVKTFRMGGVATLLKQCPHALFVPVAIKNSWKIVQFGQFPLNVGLAISWKVLTPIATTGKAPEEVILEAENAIKKELNQQ